MGINKNKTALILLLITIISVSCTEKVCIIEKQDTKVRIDSVYVYKVKTMNNSLQIYETSKKFIKGDTIEIL
jgi:hypothetical protein